MTCALHSSVEHAMTYLQDALTWCSRERRAPGGFPEGDVVSPYEPIYSELQSVEQVNDKIVEASLNKSLPEVTDWWFLHQVGYTDPSVSPDFFTLLKAATPKTIGVLISPTLESLQSNFLLITLNPVIDEETKTAAINSYMEKLVGQAVTVR
jgi:hypothetical protein